jgi:hypothetical protein
VPCRVIAGRIDPSFAEIERHVFGTDWLVVCYIVTKTPDDMAVPATDWLASSNLEHQVIRRAEAVGCYRCGRLFTPGCGGWYAVYRAGKNRSTPLSRKHFEFANGALGALPARHRRDQAMSVAYEDALRKKRASFTD